VAGSGVFNPRAKGRGPAIATKVSREVLFASPAGLMSAMIQLPSVAEIDEMAQQGGGSSRAAMEGSDGEEQLKSESDGDLADLRDSEG